MVEEKRDIKVRLQKNTYKKSPLVGDLIAENISLKKR